MEIGPPEQVIGQPQDERTRQFLARFLDAHAPAPRKPPPDDTPHLQLDGLQHHV